MNSITRYVAVLAGFLAAGSCMSVGAVTAKVTAVGTYASGAIFVYFDKPIADCSTIARADVPAADPSNKHVLAIATTAFATGSDVEVRAGSCSGLYPLWSPVGDTYIYLKK